MPKNHQETLDNRAECEAAEKGSCKQHDESLVFALRDKHHEFSLGLSTVLECLKFAENEGVIPPLPTDWWFEVGELIKIPSNPI